MTVVALGELTLGAALPGAAAAASAGVSGINTALPDIAGRIARLTDALLRLQSMPVFPDFTPSVLLAGATFDAIQLAIRTPGLSPPDFSLACLAVAAELAALRAALESAQASLDSIIGFQGHLSAGGIAAYAFDGARGALGAELGSAVGGGSAPAHALVLYTEQPNAWTAISAVCKVTP